MLDRHRFAFRFESGPAGHVVDALRPYRNPDGGFGHGLEPDLRGPESQPVPLAHALAILDEVGRPDSDIAGNACEWLSSVTTKEGGVPFVLASVLDAPHAPWWVPTGRASLNPTAGIVGLLLKHGVSHPWVEQATEFCWRTLPQAVPSLSADDAISVLAFLEHAPDRARAETLLGDVGARIVDELVALDPAAPGYVKSPLDFTPAPERLARRLFDDATIERHLDALAARRQPDGGWPITWEPPSPAAVHEWRGFVTNDALDVLQSYGRLRGADPPR